MGEKFVHKFLDFIGLKLGESAGFSRERLCPRQQINMAIRKTFKRECLTQFGRKGFSKVFDNSQLQAFK